MILIVMAALALPLAGIAWFVRGYMDSRNAPNASGPTPAAVAEPLRNSLELVASESLGTAAAALDEHVVEIRVPQPNLAARVERINSIAMAAGGSVLEMPPMSGATEGSSGEAWRLLVTLPATRSSIFRRALEGMPVDFGSVESEGDTELIDIRLVVEP